MLHLQGDDKYAAAARAEGGRAFRELFATGALHSAANDNPAERTLPRPMGGGLDRKRLERVLVYIERRLTQRISLDDLASAACLSPFHFSRLFHRSTGHSPHRYLIERRIELARRMIREQAGSLAQIAFDTGFGSQASFSRAFRKTTGISPSRYRALHVGG